jgi:SHS2 domain-containing protein
MLKENIQDHYKEIEHTADIGLDVYAKDFSGLLHQAGLGMLQLLGVNEPKNNAEALDLEFTFSQLEDVLVQALSEVLYQIEANDCIYLPERVIIRDLNACVHYVGIDSKDDLSEIKAVTYHQMKIVDDEKGLHTIIVFDV